MIQKNNDLIIYIGGIFNDNYTSRGNAISPAANRWQKGFIEGLLSNNIEVKIISNIPHQVWPLGDLYVKSVRSAFLFKDTTGINYLNLPYIKSFLISIKVFIIFFKSHIKKRKPLCVITYNGATDNTFVSYVIQKFFNIKWIDLCADHYDPQKNWSNYNCLAKKAWGHIFLSDFAYKNAPFDKKYFLEGGFELKSFSQKPKGDKFIILFSGMMSKWGGVDLLLEGFKKIAEKNVELWICGHGGHKTLLSDIVCDDRIKYFGFVSNDRLQELSLMADAFINPRPTYINGNKMNFPSKILEYLSYGKPVVSTWTAGISSEYKDVLIVLDDDTPDNISKEILEVYNWTNSDFNYYYRNVVKFARTKSWEYQTKLFINWLKENI
jgi:glycosyltransferase involved in cell wall biosynthesis